MKKKRFIIYVSIYFSLFTIIGISFFYLSKLNALQNHTEEVDHAYQVIFHLNELEKRVLDGETGQRGFIMTRDSVFLVPYIEANKKISRTLISLDALTDPTRFRQGALDTLKIFIYKRFESLRKGLNADPAIRAWKIKKKYYPGKHYMDKIRKVIEELKGTQYAVLRNRNVQRAASAEDSKLSSLLLLLIAFSACCAGALGVITYFNRSHKYGAQLEANLVRLKTLNDEIGALTYASTHNLQEPMRKVQVIIDRLNPENGVSDAQLQESLGRIRQIYAQQQQINNTIVDYYVILTNPVRKERIATKKWIANVLKHPEWNDRFEWKIDPLQYIHADAYQLSLLFRHLFHNAIHYSHPDRPLSIHIREHAITAREEQQLPGLKEKDYYAIAISDNGVGLDAMYHAKIFELFQKVDDAKPGAASGNGMGLSFSKRIMLNHDGWIMAQQGECEGLTIVLFFPQEE
jgi:signal transduction histidine kinase